MEFSEHIDMRKQTSHSKLESCTIYFTMSDIPYYQRYGSETAVVRILILKSGQENTERKE